MRNAAIRLHVVQFAGALARRERRLRLTTWGKLARAGLATLCLGFPAVVFIASPAPAPAAAAGALDPTFHGDGKVTTDIGAGTVDAGEDLAVQPDGKIVAVGTTSGSVSADFALVRYNTGGGLDTSFGTGGKVVTDIGVTSDIAEALALQPDGKIVAWVPRPTTSAWSATTPTAPWTPASTPTARS